MFWPQLQVAQIEREVDPRLPFLHPKNQILTKQLKQLGQRLDSGRNPISLDVGNDDRRNTGSDRYVFLAQSSPLSRSAKKVARLNRIHIEAFYGMNLVVTEFA
jgi:hypothetical protein